MWNQRRIEPTGNGDYVLRLPEEERELLRFLPDELRSLLEVMPGDPVAHVEQDGVLEVSLRAHQ